LKLSYVNYLNPYSRRNVTICVNYFRVLALAFLVASPMYGQVEKRSRASFVGVWESSDQRELWCRVELGKDKGRMFTFQGEKHLSTLFFWWNMDSANEKLTFGVNGAAKILGKDQLQLMLSPVNTNIVTVRDGFLKRAQPGGK